ncbi:MAG: hypothetical protein Q4C25_09385, partial [Bacillota bacterium]|nr:hypothetical protein [Bacillota bacterium]
MGIETITSKIIGEAEETARALLKTAEEESGHILAEAHARAKILEEEAQKSGEEEKKRLIARRRSLAYM